MMTGLLTCPVIEQNINWKKSNDFKKIQNTAFW